MIMLTGKQRSYLKGLANQLNPMLQIGKDGISDSFLQQLEENLEDHELVKINILNNNYLDTKETAFELCEQLDAEFVQAIGNKVVIYREAEEEPEIQLPR
jgi:RNA-binding protein